LARVAFIVTTCHEFEGIKACSATLKQHGHMTDCFITSDLVCQRQRGRVYVRASGVHAG
jgi:hypothetical protein